MRIVFYFSVLIGAVATFIGLLAPLLPYWELTNHFRPFVLLGALLLAGLSYWFFGLSSFFYSAAVLVGVNVLLLGMALQDTVDKGNGKGQTLKVMTLNMWVGNKQIRKVVKFIEAEAPDIFVLQEFTPWQFERLLPLLKKSYPYHYSCAHQYSCLMAVFSKRPWRKVTHLGRTFASKEKSFLNRPPLIVVEFPATDTQKGFSVLATHISWPFHPYRQVADMKWLKTYVNKTKKPLILAGDLNLSPWSWKLFRLQQKTGLKRHTTFLHSWPADKLKPFVQLDHILTSSGIKGVFVKVGGYVGSDHLPVIATLELPLQR